jgi:hypothetical protein
MLTAAIAAARITFATFAMISFSASGETRRCFWEDWITLPQIPSRFLEHNAELHCMRGAADCGEYRQAAGARLAL